MWLQDSEELDTTEQASEEVESQELLSALEQPDSPIAVPGTGSAGSDATAGSSIAASQSSAGTLQAQRQSSPISGLDTDPPLNNPKETSSTSKTGNSSTGPRHLPEVKKLLSETGSAGSNRSPGRLADAHQAARLRGGNHDAAQLQQQQRWSDAELDPEHVSLPAKLPTSICTRCPQISHACAAREWAQTVHLLASAVVLFLHAAGQPSGGLLYPCLQQPDSHAEPSTWICWHSCSCC